jgi:hypothetical protein
MSQDSSQSRQCEGQWVRKYDTDEIRFYYYNNFFRYSQWDDPDPTTTVYERFEFKIEKVESKGVKFLLKVYIDNDGYAIIQRSNFCNLQNFNNKDRRWLAFRINRTRVHKTPFGQDFIAYAMVTVLCATESDVQQAEAQLNKMVKSTGTC